MSAHDATVVGPWSKARIAISVSLGLLLFAAAAGLTTWLAERPGLRARLDLTHSGRNTLDPVLADIVDKLPERATIEVFFKPLPRHFEAVGIEAQARMQQLLLVLQNAASDKIKVIDHSPENLAESAEALARLHVDGYEFGMLVVHRDKNRVRLLLDKDIAEFNVGNPDPNHFVPARMVAFRGEQALANALKRVAANARPKIYFTTGHGERTLYGAAAKTGVESEDLGAVVAALSEDGFEIERFDGAGSPIPADCAVLAIVDPTQAQSEAELGAIYAYVDAGGRLLVTGSHSYPTGNGSTRALAAHYGVDIGLGYVAEEIASASGPVEGIVNCANIYTRSDGLQVAHPVTASLARFGRAVLSPLAHPLARQNPPSNVVLAQLVSSGPYSWVELPDANGKFDWRPDPTREESGKRFGLVYAAQVTPQGSVESPGEERQGRLIVLGSPEALSSGALATNKDFALNAFNWLGAREYRLSVAPREETRRMLDVRQAGKLLTLRSLALFLLPGLCLLGGLVTWSMRRR